MVVFDQIVFDHGTDAAKAGATGLAVDLHPDVHLGAVSRLGGPGEAVFHRLDHQFGIDHLFARDRFCGLQKLQLVG